RFDVAGWVELARPTVSARSGVPLPEEIIASNGFLCHNEPSSHVRGAFRVSRTPAFCDGLARRDFLRLGVAGVLGAGVVLPRLLAARAADGPTKDVSLIFLFLHGGLSTIDTLDLKPDAPAEFRGEFKPIATNVPGIQIGEHLPRLSRQL